MEYLYIKNMDLKILEPHDCTCGSDPQIHYYYAGTNFIACSDCECRTDDYLKLEDTIRAWNKRFGRVIFSNMSD